MAASLLLIFPPTLIIENKKWVNTVPASLSVIDAPAFVDVNYHDNGITPIDQVTDAILPNPGCEAIPSQQFVPLAGIISQFVKALLDSCPYLFWVPPKLCFGRLTECYFE
jgi:hypothetical protein